MTSFIAACGSGRFTSFIPAVPAAWSVTTIAFMIIFSSVICLFELGSVDAPAIDKMSSIVELLFSVSAICAVCFDRGSHQA
jgi:hypothetical protein